MFLYMYRYMREYVLMFRMQSVFLCHDDKHHIKCGKPGFPLAAVEHGRQVIISLDQSFQVGDHDFSHFSLIPSVCLDIDIPISMNDSWYTGKVFVGYKDAAFEASSPLRHATELYSLLIERVGSKTILFLYTDGGPDHHITYGSVQLALIAMFLNLDLDLVVAGRTAPHHSWRNPVERVMAVVNLGLQCIGIMRTEGSDAFEQAIKNVSNLQQLRQAAYNFKDDYNQSIAAPKALLSNITKRLELKGEKLKVFESAKEQEIEAFWEVLLTVDDTLRMTDTTKAVLKSKEKLQKFMKHCCQIRKYSFCIKKCGSSDCTLCKPVRIDPEVFKSIHFLRDPILDDDQHYKTFSAVYGTNTTECDLK